MSAFNIFIYGLLSFINAWFYNLPVTCTCFLPESLETMSDAIKCEAVVFQNGSIHDVSVEEDVQTTSIKMLDCQICDRKYTSMYSLKRHLKIHEPENHKFRCTKCNQFFKCAESKEKHDMEKHAETKNVCEVCGKVFRYGSGLRDHAKIHDLGSFKYVCPFEGCQKRFNRKSRCLDHLILHSGTKPYSCENCNKAFWNKYEKTHHELICKKERELKCDVCGKTFGHRSTLFNHRNAHRPMPMFICSCGKEYKYRSGLRNHKAINNHT